MHDRRYTLDSMNCVDSNQSAASPLICLLLHCVFRVIVLSAEDSGSVLGRRPLVSKAPGSNPVANGL